jgi:arsenate reductase
MSDAQWMDAMSRDGKLVKRPVLVDGSRVLVGFDADSYASTFGKKHKKGD